MIQFQTFVKVTSNIIMPVRALFLRVLSLQGFFFYFNGSSLAFLKGPFSGPFFKHSGPPSLFLGSLFTKEPFLFSWVHSLSFHRPTLLFVAPCLFSRTLYLASRVFFLFSRALSLFKGPPSSRILFLF